MVYTALFSEKPQYSNQLWKGNSRFCFLSWVAALEGLVIMKFLKQNLTFSNISKPFCIKTLLRFWQMEKSIPQDKISCCKKKGCLLLWPDSGSLSLQLRQNHDVAGRVRLFRFQEIQKNHPFPIPNYSAHFFTCWGLHLELVFQWGICISLLHGLQFWLQFVAVTPLEKLWPRKLSPPALC